MQMAYYLTLTIIGAFFLIMSHSFVLTSDVCVFVYFGERCETVCEFFVRVLRSTGVSCSSLTNVKVVLGSRSPFILVLVEVTVICYKLH